MADDNLITHYQLTATNVTIQTSQLMRIVETLATTKDHETAKEIYPIMEKLLAQLQEVYFKAMDIEYDLRWAAKLPRKQPQTHTVAETAATNIVDKWLNTLSPEQREQLKYLAKDKT